MEKFKLFGEQFWVFIYLFLSYILFIDHLSILGIFKANTDLDRLYQPTLIEIIYSAYLPITVT